MMRTVDQISNYRSELDAVVAALHKRQKNGLTAYDCFASKIAGGAKTVEFHGGEKVREWSEKSVSDAREGVVQMAVDWRGTTADAVKALEPIAKFQWNPTTERETDEAIGVLSSAIRKNGYAFVPRGGRALGGTSEFKRSWFDRLVSAIVSRDNGFRCPLGIEEMRG